jgi:lysophospholipase L1-like esterase
MKRFLLALLPFLLLYGAEARIRGGGTSAALTYVWRGTGQNMRVALQAFGGGSNWSSTYRARHCTNTAFRYAKFVISTFYINGATPVDTDLPNNYNFQVGVENPWNNSLTGIPARIAVTFSGNNSVSYTAGTPGSPAGYIESDTVDFGSTISAGACFGLWTTQEVPSQAAGELMIVTNAQNYINRYTGQTQSTSSQITAGTALTASSITAVGSTINTGGYGLEPVMMLIQVPATSTQQFVLDIGDSINYGVGEGGLGSNNLGAYGDAMGDAQANPAWAARWIEEVLSHEMVNMAKGGDAFSYYSPTNWQYRLLLFALANPTFILSQNGHNDLTQGHGASVIKGNALSLFSELNTILPGIPICQSTVTPGSSSTAEWTATNASDQTVASFWGNSASNRGVWNDSHVRQYPSDLGTACWIDPNPAIEYGYNEGVTTSETSLWYGNGTYTLTGNVTSSSTSITGVTVPSNIIAGASLVDTAGCIPANDIVTVVGGSTLTLNVAATCSQTGDTITYNTNSYTIDGGHPNSYGYYNTVQQIYATYHGVQYADPFTQSAVQVQLTNTTPLTAATHGSAYSNTLTVSGGTSPYTCALISAYPDTGSWLSSNTSCVLSGTPSTAETETVIEKVTDNASNVAYKTFLLTVN